VYLSINDHVIIEHIQAAVMCLLVPVEAMSNRPRTAGAISLQSFLFKKDEDCRAGNLLQIHFFGRETQARCDGNSTKYLTTSKSQYKRP